MGKYNSVKERAANVIAAAIRRDGFHISSQSADAIYSLAEMLANDPKCEVSIADRFSVRLESCPPARAVDVIKAIRLLTSLDLRAAKTLYDRRPYCILTGKSEAEAKAAAKYLREAGATVTVVEE